MRSAESRAFAHIVPASLPALLWCAAVLLAGCAGPADPGVNGPGSAPASRATSVAASAPSASAASVAPPAVVTPQVQHAFDEAVRLLQAGRTAEAEKALQALVREQPGLAGPHANLGLLHRQAGRSAEAVAELERAVELSPGQPAYWNELGIAYRQHGRFQQAREAYEHALALQPQYAAAVLNLGVLDDLYLGDAPQALALYTRYLALQPQGDPTVAKWVAELKNRKPAVATASRKEQP
jgi:Flp pilus assembly protein TadD